MAIKKGFSFSPKSGFTGSAGKKPVRGYLRGGPVKATPKPTKKSC